MSCVDATPSLTTATALARCSGVEACSWRSSTISSSDISVLAQCTAPMPMRKMAKPSDRPSTMFWVLAMPIPGKKKVASSGMAK